MYQQQSMTREQENGPAIDVNEGARSKPERSCTRSEATGVLTRESSIGISNWSWSQLPGKITLLKVPVSLG